MHEQDVFYGRAQELELLRAPVERAKYDVICGAPGIGKSALRYRYQQLASEAGEFDEVIELDAREWSSEPATALPAALGLALGVGAQLEGDVLANVLGEPVARLLIIENAEWCDEEELAGVLDEHAALMERGRILVLTRSMEAPWRDRQSVVRHELGPLGSPDDALAAKSLFSHHAQRSIEELEREGLSGLLDMLCYHPFSIELCAALCRWTGMAHVRAHIDAIASEVATSSMRAASVWSPGRVRSLFAHSWGQLDAQTRAGLRELAIFPMPVASTRVATFLGHRIVLSDVLEQATRYGLVSVSQRSDGVAMLRMAHVFRVFCLDELSAHPAQRAALIEACAVALVHRHRDVPTHVALLHDLEALDRARADTSLIRKLCLEEHTSTDAATRLRLARICFATHVMQESSLLVADELRGIVEQHEGDARGDVQAQRTFLLVELTLEELVRGYGDASISQLEHLDERLVALDGSESRRLQWWLATQLVWARIIRGEYDLAERRIARMCQRQATYEARGILVEPRIIACLRMREASLFYQQGRHDEALEAHEKSLHFAREAGDERSWVMLAHNLSILYTALSRLDEAMRCLQLARRHERYMSVSFNATNEISLGLLHLRCDELDLARRHLALARQKVTRGGLSGNLALIDINLASVELSAGNVEGARAFAARAVAASSGHDPYVHGHANLLVCNCLMVQRDHVGAIEVIDAVLEELGHSPYELPLEFCLIGMKLIAQLAICEDISVGEHTFCQLATLRDELAGDRVFASMFEHLENFVVLERHLRAPARQSRATLLAWLAHTFALARAAHPEHESFRLLDTLRRGHLSGRLFEIYEAIWQHFHVERERGAWLIARDGRLTCTPEGTWIDLSAHELLAQLVGLLGVPLRHEGREALTLDELEEALWPDEKIMPEAASNRLHVSLSRLRRRGFGALIVRQGERYSLDANAKVLWF